MLKRRIKQVTILLLFALCAALLLRAAAYSLRPDDASVRTRLEGFYAEPPGSLDVVFVGSSAVYAFFSPLRLWQDTGLTSYPFATPNQSVAMIRYALEECRKTQPGALYVIELRAMLASDEDRAAIAADLRRMSDNMPYSPTRSRMLAALAEPSERLAHEFDLAVYHDRWPQLTPADLRCSWGKADPLKGYPLQPHVQPIQSSDHSRENLRIPPNAQNEADLRDLLAYCRDEGINALFIATPYALSRQQAKQYNAVGGIVAECGGAFIDLSKQTQAIGLDFATDYSDFRHTNTRGMLKCTAYLGELLAQRGVVPSPKAEAVTLDWQRCYEAYLPQEIEAVRRIEAQLSPEQEREGT